LYLIYHSEPNPTEEAEEEWELFRLAEEEEAELQNLVEIVGNVS
jgi:hypothetical protein